MHDIRAIRENPAAFDAALARRGLDGMSQEILAIDEARRAKILAAETAQAAQNAASKEVGAAKARSSAMAASRAAMLMRKSPSDGTRRSARLPRPRVSIAF